MALQQEEAGTSPEQTGREQGEAETGREFVTRGRARWLDEEAAPAELKKAGVDHLVLRTDQSFEPALRQLFRARGWIGRGAR